MLAFHNDPKIKEYYLSRVKAHQLADEIHQGRYVDEENKRYCAVGCTLHNADHGAYESEMGIPRILACLEDGIFERLPLPRAKLWPLEFLEAINVGANLESVWPKFAVWLLTDKECGVIQYAKTDEQRSAIETVANHYSDYKNITREMWIKARRAAADAAYAAAAAAASAASAAVHAAAAYVASASASAAAAAAYAVVHAAAAAAASAASAYDAASEKHRIAQANKLLEILNSEK